MKEKPILFSTAMIQAILAGRKSQTRRTMKPQPPHHTFSIYPREGLNVKTEGGQYVKSRFQKGDNLWVREKFRIYNSSDECACYDECVCAKYSGKPIYYANTLCDEDKWKPSIFMSKDFARIWLEVTNVRVERLQDISEEDAKAEGVEILNDEFHDMYKRYDTYKGRPLIETVGTAKESYQTLWESINGKGSWYLNPWVWVIEFKRMEGKK